MFIVCVDCDFLLKYIDMQHNIYHSETTYTINFFFLYNINVAKTKKKKTNGKSI